jgi:putative secretion ATPase (PEP-CTERM system associated)
MYEAFYGFNERPFQLTPTPHIFYAGKLHKRALAYLQYGLSQGEGFIVITGDIGTGKTTIANQLLAKLDHDHILARQIVTAKLAPDDLLRMITAVFQLPIQQHNKASYLDAISNFLTQLHHQGKRALLLVDEAQNLPLESIEELRMLSNFQLAGKPLLQSFLLGQNELNAIIQAPNMEQFRQRIIASSNLSALSLEETAAYIQCRIEQAGACASLLHEDCFAPIHQFTQGIPRRINNLMDRVLLFGFLEEKQPLTAQDVEQVIQELASEIAYQTPPAASASATQPTTTLFAPQNATADHANAASIQQSPYHGMLSELSALLDQSLESKIKMARDLDALLSQHHAHSVQVLQAKALDPLSSPRHVAHSSATADLDGAATTNANTPD